VRSGGKVWAALLVLAIVTAACTSPDDDARPTSTVVTPTKPVFQDQRLRPVRMTSGRALTYVQPETASQILCQLLDKEDWGRLLGGRIGREPLGDPYAGCQIATEQGMLRMQMRESADAFEAETTIAGRPAIVYERLGEDAVVFIVALTDDALHAAPAGQHLTLRTLEVEMVGDDPEAERDVATRVLTEVVPLLVKEAEPLPAVDDQGHIPYAPTPLTGGDQFVDLPLPVQALQLCTVLLEGEGFRTAAKEVDVLDSGRCGLSTEQGTVAVEAKHSSLPIASYPDTVAGRPAREMADLPGVDVRLRDDAEIALSVSAPDSVALAEKLVPLLIG
jgi:hypothetical protein